MRFKLGKCEIQIDYLFILTLSVVALFKSHSVFDVLIYSSLHELGHLAALFMFAKAPRKITLSYYGFAISYCDDISRIAETVVLLSGPAVNLIFYLINGNICSLVLFLLNIMPIFPLDMGRIFRLYMPLFSRYISIAALVLICIFTAYMLFFYKSYSLLFAVTYLLIYAVGREE